MAGRREVTASFVGTAPEYYDYFIYGTAAALVFPTLFFAIDSRTVATLASFGTFAVGFLVRPLGAALFGHLGDRIGRQRVLVVTVLIMGTSTFLIGALPTYAAIGVAAPILLILLRICQGIGLGGEWSGAVLLTTENAAPERRGFAGSWTQMGSPLGLLLATGAFAIVTALPNEEFLAWAWRVPFLLSAALVAFGLWIRLRVGETAAFLAVSRERDRSPLPIVDLFRMHRRNVVCGIFARVGIDTTFYLVSVYSLSYVANHVGGSRATVLTGLVVAAIISLGTMPLFGYLADRWGDRRVLAFGLVFMGLFSYPFFRMLESGDAVLITLAMVLAFSVGISAGFSPFAGFLTHLFRPRVRYSGTALTFQIAGILGGALAPTVAVLLVAASGGSVFIAAYWSGVCVISLVAMSLIHEFFDGDDTQPTD
jgi:MFS family permease